MYEALYQRTIRIEVIIAEANSPYGTNTKLPNFPPQSTQLDRVVVFLTSA
jgi:hypothetical protein